MLTQINVNVIKIIRLQVHNNIFENITFSTIKDFDILCYLTFIQDLSYRSQLQQKPHSELDMAANAFI